MSAKSEVAASGLDTAKLTLSAILVVAGIFAFYHFEAYSALWRVLGLLAATGAAVAVAYQTAVGRRVWQFGLDSRMEVRKVVWPSRQECRCARGAGRRTRGAGRVADSPRTAREPRE